MYRTAILKIEGGGALDCWSPPDLALHEGDLCIVARGDILEYGRIGGLMEADGEPPEGRDAPAKVVRRATLQDQSKADETAVLGKMAMKTCLAIAQKSNLPIRIVRGHYSFDRSVIMIEFASADRVDAHELNRQLAVELRARVELKQLGVRDEAGLIGGIGPCGRELCCCTWIKRFASINVKMAKVQGLSLNPAAIGGCCGRLKCCLGYEHEHYRELVRRVPAKGARVQCPDGKGCVEDRNLLRQRVKVCMDDERIVEYSADQVREIWGGKSRGRRRFDENSDNERSESESSGEEGNGGLRDDDAGGDHGPRPDEGGGDGRRNRNVPEQRRRGSRYPHRG